MKATKKKPPSTGATENNPTLVLRIEQGPQGPVSMSGRESSTPRLPKTITLRWLFRYVPWRFWITAASVVGGAFLLGIQASRISLVQEIFGLDAKSTGAMSATQRDQIPRSGI